MYSVNQSIRVGLFFLLGTALVWVLYETLSESTFYKAQGYHVQAAFSDLKQLKLGDDVRMAGVKIGSVADARLIAGRAVATLNIEHAFTIPKDSVAKISTSGLLGANLVAITPGSASEHLAPGGMLVSLETADFGAIVEQIGDIGKRIDKFLGSLERSIYGQGQPQGTLGMLLHDAELAQDLKATLHHLAQFSAKLNSEQSTLGRLVSEDTLYQKAMDAVSRVQGAVSTIEDSGPITAIGVAASALF